MEFRPIFYTFRPIWIKFVGRDSSVGMATCWTVLIPNPSGGEISFHSPEHRWGSSSLLCNVYRVYFPKGKAGGVWSYPPTPCNAEVKERVKLYLYSPSGLSWPVLW